MFCELTRGIILSNQNRAMSNVDTSHITNNYIATVMTIKQCLGLFAVLLNTTSVLRIRESKLI